MYTRSDEVRTANFATFTEPEWLRSLNASKLAGQIPAIPPSTVSNGNIVYPSGVDLQSICSWTRELRGLLNGDGAFADASFLFRVSARAATGCFGPHDIQEAPDGMYGVSFDDGVSLGEM